LPLFCLIGQFQVSIEENGVGIEEDWSSPKVDISVME